MHLRNSQKSRRIYWRENVEETEIRMGAEDFGYYSQQIPACFYRVGVMNKEKGIISGVHTPTFNIDENAIEIGMGMMAWLGSNSKILIQRIERTTARVLIQRWCMKICFIPIKKWRLFNLFSKYQFQ